MDELGLDASQFTAWFPHVHEEPFVRVDIKDAPVSLWTELLRVAVRRCYITDAVLAESALSRGVSQVEIIASRLPDPGSVRSGDFGEIVVYLYHAARAHPRRLIGPKKWRLKQDRSKPAPYSDVVHFLLPAWPQASAADSIFCSEVKAKSTSGKFAPIAAALAGSEKDRMSRLSDTLVWLRERALTQDLGQVTLAHLNRFIDATEHPPAGRHFYAVAVICSSLVDAELLNLGALSSPGTSLIIVVVPNLKATYTAVFEAALQTPIASVAP